MQHSITAPLRTLHAICSPACFAPGLASATLFLHLAAASAPAQTLTWSDHFGVPQVSDFAWAATADMAGGVFVGGTTTGALPGGGGLNGTADPWIARFDGSGTRLWVKQFGTAGSDRLHDVQSDGAGGVFAAGRTPLDLAGPSAGGFDAWIARFDGAGDPTWAVQLGTAGYQSAEDLALDGAGGFYVLGTTDASLGGPHSGLVDTWLARYDANGQQIWIRQLGGGGNDGPAALASDTDGGVFVMGWTSGGFAGPHAGLNDAWLARYDSSGARLWIQQFGTAGWDFPLDATPDGTGGVYLAGYSEDNTQPNNSTPWCRRYDASGHPLWTREFVSDNVDRPEAIFLDANGGPSVVMNRFSATDGGPLIVRYDSLGNERWTRSLSASGLSYARGASSDGGRSFFVTGDGPDTPGYSDIWTGRWDNAFMSSDYCGAALNSTGVSAEAYAAGANEVALNNLTLSVQALPTDTFGFFICSTTTGFATAPGVDGVLCLGASIGRFVGPGQVRNSGASGSFSLTVDVASIPQPMGSVAVQPGETWHFQAWYRDANPSLTSNFTNGVSVPFQ